MRKIALSDGQKAKWISSLVEAGQEMGWPADARQELIEALSEPGSSTMAMDNWGALWAAAQCWGQLGDAPRSFEMSKILERMDARFSGIWVAAAGALGGKRQDCWIAIEAAKLLSGRRLELRELCRSAAVWMLGDSFELLARSARSAGFDPARGVGAGEARSVLACAARAGNLEVGKWLLAEGARVGSAELFSALAAGSAPFALAIESRGLWRARVDLGALAGIDMGERVGSSNAGMGLAALMGSSSACVEMALARGAWATGEGMRQDAAAAWKLGEAGRKGVMELVRLLDARQAMELADGVARVSTGAEELRALAERQVLGETVSLEVEGAESKRL